MHARGMKLTALLFDVDGTLADTERDGHRVAFNRAFRDAGLDWEWDVALYGELLAITGGQERMRYYLEHYPCTRPAEEDLDEFFRGLHRAKNRHYAALMSAGGIDLRPGVRRLLGEARRAGVRLAIATTTTRSNVEALLAQTLGAESPQWFEVIATADEVPDKKPSPAVYHYVLEQMRLPASGCVAFEDSLNGLKASAAAGLVTLVTENAYTAGSDFAAAALVLDQLGEPDAPFAVRGGRDREHLDLSRGYVDLTLLNEMLSG